MTLVKICGNTNREDVECAISAGADFIGLIFAPSKRQISVDTARQIKAAFTKFDRFAGVFVNESLENLRSIARQLQLTWLQLHGDETPEYCKALTDEGFRIIKTFPIRTGTDLSKIRNYPADKYLFDSYQSGERGGTGTQFDWNTILNFPDLSKKIFLAGGLNPSNIETCIRKVHPFAVDVCSGVESKPGKKDHGLVRQFIQNARQLTAS